MSTGTLPQLAQSTIRFIINRSLGNDKGTTWADVRFHHTSCNFLGLMPVNQFGLRVQPGDDVTIFWRAAPTAEVGCVTPAAEVSSARFALPVVFRCGPNGYIFPLHSYKDGAVGQVSLWLPGDGRVLVDQIFLPFPAGTLGYTTTKERDVNNEHRVIDLLCVQKVREIFRLNKYDLFDTYIDADTAELNLPADHDIMWDWAATDLEALQRKEAEFKQKLANVTKLLTVVTNHVVATNATLVHGAAAAEPPTKKSRPVGPDEQRLIATKK